MNKNILSLLEIKKFSMILLLISILVILPRIHTLFIDIYNGDEANYSSHALIMLDDGIPYKDFVEKKPPLIYFIYYITFAIFGISLKAVHFIVILTTILCSIFIYFTCSINI